MSNSESSFEKWWENFYPYKEFEDYLLWLEKKAIARKAWNDSRKETS